MAILPDDFNSGIPSDPDDKENKCRSCGQIVFKRWAHWPNRFLKIKPGGIFVFERFKDDSSN